MALNFPNSPTNGQLYTDTNSGNSWTWDSANTCWKSTSTYIQTITVASSAPGTPAVGQLWWNQDYGRLLVYYNDGTSSQWVDASPSDYTSALAYNTANAVFNQSNTVYGVANAAFGKANSSLQNTSGTFAGNLSISGNLDLSLTTSALKLPIGTTAQRPAGTDGFIRYNTSTGAPEWYNSTSSSWIPVFQQANNTTYSAGYLAVGGGGGGGGGEANPGGDGGGGGGAGGLIESSFNLISGGVYNITVGSGGAGGTGGAGGSGPGGRGTDSIIYGPGISPIIAYGGGGGGDGNENNNASGGGSGGGAGNGYSQAYVGGSGMYKQGNAGGDCTTSSTVNRGGSGGGGAGTSGVSRTSTNGGNGGDGIGSRITGSLLYYAGGGGGGPCGTSAAGAGGSSVGGNGATSSSAAGGGATNRGSGGGGGVGHNTGNVNGGAGSAGVVVITYQNTTQRASGGTVTSYTIGGYTWWVHTFTTSGTFTA